MSTFGDLSTNEGLKNLNKYLLEHSYVTGFLLTAEDFTAFDTVGSEPDNTTYPNAARWYRHLASFTEEERKEYTGEETAAEEEAAPEEEAPAAAEEATGASAGDDEVDLFADDEDVEDERSRMIEERARQEMEKKRAQGKLAIAKSMVVLDVKPLDDETDMAEVERLVREIELEGMEWKASKLVDVCYGIKKLQISCVVLDEVVSIDELIEKIQEFEDQVQSVDIAAFNKL